MEQTIHIYEATNRYVAGEAIPSDFVRKAKTLDRNSHNQIRLTYQDSLFARTFDYEEQFREIVSQEGLESTVRRLREAWIEYYSVYLAQELGGVLTPAQIREKLLPEFEPLLVKFLQGTREHGADFYESGEFKTQIEPYLKEEAIIARTVTVLSPSSQDTVNSREGVKRAFDRTGEVLGNWEDVRLEEELFGAHGFNIFQSYGFTVSLSLPGRIMETNADEQENGLLIWKFQEGDFLYKDYVLRGYSRVFYPIRIALAVILAVVLGLIGIGRVLLKKRKP